MWANQNFWTIASYVVSASLTLWGTLDFILDELELRRNRLRERPKRRKRIGGLLVAALGILLLVASWRVAILSGDEVQTELTRQRQRAHAAERSLVSLQRRVQDRHVTRAQQRCLTEFFFNTPGLGISISHQTGDEEAARYAAELSRALRVAQLRVTDSGAARMPDREVEGLFIRVRNTNNVPPRAMTLVDPLGKCGVSISMTSDGRLTVGDVDLFVAPQP